MNIAIYGMSSNTGGVETFIMNIYRSLKQDKHTFYFFTTEDNICYENEIIDNGDYIIKYTARRKNIKNQKKELKEIFSKYKFNIYWHNCCSLSNIEEIKQAYNANVPIRIIHSHNSKNMGNFLTLLLHTKNKYCLSKYVTHFFACSDVAGKWMFPNKVYKDIVIFHNSIDTRSYLYNSKTQKEMRKLYHINDDTLIIGHVGRFHFQKNHKYLIEIFNRLYNQNKNVLLVLCGDGTLKNEILNLVKKYNLQKKVLFLGNQSEMSKIYQMFDILCFPSLFEGLPFVLVEAQAAGIPCIVSNTVSSEAKLTNLVFFEDINKNPSIWVDKIEKIKLIKKRNTYKDIVENGYDIENNKKQFYLIINQKR